MDSGEQKEKWKTKILIPNGWRVWGHWYKLELQSAMGLWAITLDQTLKTSKQCLSSMTSIFYSNKADNNIAFVCKSHYVDCLINELGIDNSLGNPTYTPTTHTKEEIRTIIGLLYIPLHFQSKKKNWIYRLSTGFIYYKAGYIAKWFTKPPPKLSTYNVYSIRGQNRTSELLWH